MLSAYCFMIAAAVVNVVSFTIFPKSRRDARYVVFFLVCVFRALLPRLDAERVCFFDLGLISSPVVGRLCATFAEVSFGHLMGDLLWHLTPRRPAAARAGITLLIPLLTTLANFFCWYGVSTRNQYWNIVEESCWAAAAFLAVLYTLVRLPWHKDFAVMVFLTGAGIYCAYLVLVDVPMYYRRWSVDERAGRRYLTFWTGVEDMSRCHNVNADTMFWKEDFTWMVPYFSLGVLAAQWAAGRLQGRPPLVL